MIVVLGNPSVGQGEHGPVAGGLASTIARTAAAAGATVQLIGKVGDDPSGDAVLLDLARAGVGHAALLRDPGKPTRVVPASGSPAEEDDGEGEPEDLLEAAGLFGDTEPERSDEEPLPPVPMSSGPGPSLEAPDIELGLRYLVEFAVIVATEPLDERGASVVADAASFAGAHVVALVPVGEVAGPGLANATVLEIPLDDPDDAFARLVAAYAVALDAGSEADDAFRAATSNGGWEAASV